MKAKLGHTSDDEWELEESFSRGPTPSGGKKLVFNHAGAFPWSNTQILDGDIPVYFSEVSELTRHKPDITLHRGNQDGVVCAASYFQWSRSMKCGIGPDNISMQWIDFEREGLTDKKRFAFHWKGNSYTLQRAASAEHKASGFGRLLLTHFKVVEEDSGDLVALYVSNPVGTQKGTMRLRAGIEDELEILCVLGVASWRDNTRRRIVWSGAGAY